MFGNPYLVAVGFLQVLKLVKVHDEDLKAIIVPKNYLPAVVSQEEVDSIKQQFPELHTKVHTSADLGKFFISETANGVTVCKRVDIVQRLFLGGGAISITVAMKKVEINDKLVWTNPNNLPVLNPEAKLISLLKQVGFLLDRQVRRW